MDYRKVADDLIGIMFATGYNSELRTRKVADRLVLLEAEIRREYAAEFMSTEQLYKALVAADPGTSVNEHALGIINAELDARLGGDHGR